jgi:chemotaxis protein MotA
MFFIIGALIAVGSVLGGYLLAGGHLYVLWQPGEFMIILGAALGGFIIANPVTVLKRTLGIFGPLLKGSRYTKASYLELLSVLYSLFKLAKTKGDLALEGHVEKPEESPLFQNFPGFSRNHHALVFLCDYLRLLTLGTSNAHELDTIMDRELEVHHQNEHAVSSALATVADALPALGIVAAVLGVIHTMGAITEPPEILGKLIGGALVGTFTGVLASYGFVGPTAQSLEKTSAAEARYMECMKVAIIAHMQGYAPQVSIEFARKVLDDNVRPTFQEVEETVQNLPTY